MAFLTNKRNQSALIYGFIVLLLLASHVYLGLKANLKQYELIAVCIFDIWLLIIGLIDIKTLSIPIWLTAPIMVGIFTWRFLDKNYYHEPLIGFGLSPILSAGGIVFGFIVSDMITHFGNWILKYPNSPQGLIPLWTSIPIIIVNFFLYNFPLHYLILIIIALRGLMHFLYYKNKTFSQIFNNLLEKPWLIYGLILVLVIGFALYNGFVNINDNQDNKMSMTLFTICFCFLIEEILLPIIYKVFNLKFEEHDTPSVLGGGDTMLIAALGACWGPIIIINCLQASFLLVFIIVSITKALESIQGKSNNKLIKEMAFAPFISICSLIIILAEIFVRN